MWLVVSKPTQFAAVWRLIAGHSKNDEGGTLLSVPLLAYCAHLSLGDAWNKVFFGTESTGRGLVVICAFWSVLWLSGYLFYRADPYAGLLLLPTCLWVTVAAALNWAIYLLNCEKRGVR
jgi:benzodiazapine receptor